MADRPLVLERSVDADAPDMRARLFAAALVTPASLVLLSEPTPLRVVVGVAGLGYAASVVVRSRRTRRARTPETLVLTSEGFAVEGPSGRREARWSAITEIDLDSDAATLLVRVEGGEPIAIAPGYGDLSTVALHELLERHRHGANRARRG